MLPVMAIDLGNDLVLEMARQGHIAGIGAQQPFDQGMAAGHAALLGLIGHTPPSWIAMPGLAVTKTNILAAYQVVWHSPAPAGLIESRRYKGCREIGDLHADLHRRPNDRLRAPFQEPARLE
jgi:ribose transport system substrate-binding protein